jgi:micrococcal nuclease
MAICLLVLFAACSTHAVVLSEAAPATFVDEPGGFESAVVVDVIDGDTIEVGVRAISPGPGAGATDVGKTYTVRLIGIDTPESVQPNAPVECFGREASAAADALLSDREVRMVKDVEETDRFGRLLRYVYIGDEMANARLVVNGYAFAFTYPPSVRHSDLFVSLQRDAREHERGLWATDTCGGEP